MYLKEYPWSGRIRVTHAQHEERAIAQGLIAVNSILRDWVKGQITAVECGILSFEAVPARREAFARTYGNPMRSQHGQTISLKIRPDV